MTKETLSYEVGAYLRLPKARRHGKAYQIVKAILKSVVDALWRGERVKIEGFGIFEIRTRPATRSTCWKMGENKKPIGHYLKHLPPKQYVIFKPSKTLIRMINHDSGNTVIN